jgi:uncharacterized membrane protein (UPF0127 family)
VKNIRLPICLIILAGVVLFNVAQKSPVGTCSFTYHPDNTVIVGGTAIRVETAETPSQLTKGLGGRPCIGTNEGMLFVFKTPGYYPFWMKNMRFPIDIVWIGSDHKVVNVKSNVSPATYPRTFVNNDPAQYVLELPANRTAALHIGIGIPLQF